MRASKTLSWLAVISGAVPAMASAEDAAPFSYKQRVPDDVNLTVKLVPAMRDAITQADLDAEHYFPVGSGRGTLGVYDSEAGDDFVVPEGERWSIEKVVMQRVNASAKNVTDTVQQGGSAVLLDTPLPKIAVWSDDGGKPGAVVTDVHGTKCEFDVTADKVTQKAFDVTATLPSACELSAGTYWLVGSASQHFWNSATTAWYLNPGSATDSTLDPAARTNGMYQWLVRGNATANMDLIGNGAVVRNYGAPGYAGAFVCKGLVTIPKNPTPTCTEPGWQTFGRVGVDYRATSFKTAVDLGFELSGTKYTNLAVDAGVPDAGEPDAGTSDAGMMGTDAGTMMGMDGGGPVVAVDSGTATGPMDGGPGQRTDAGRGAGNDASTGGGGPDADDEDAGKGVGAAGGGGCSTQPFSNREGAWLFGLGALALGLVRRRRRRDESHSR